MAAKDAIARFRSDVWKYYRAHGRHDLPWRHTKDPYRIMVSEVMLQQTQVPRVLEKYQEFLKAFPDVHALARSSLSDVLKVWSGMGYNRRGKYLRDAAIAIVKQYKGNVPRDATSMRALPGIGPYTASAVLIFAYNTPDTLIETNVRTAFIHAFFNDPEANPQGRSLVKIPGLKHSKSYPQKLPRTDLGKKVSDRELLPLIAQAAEGQDPRTWHWALMDYGSHLKKLHKNPSRRSAHYTKQSKFEGSLRQVRGAILRELHKGAQAEKNLKMNIQRSVLGEIEKGERLNKAAKTLPRTDLGKFDRALEGLVRDGMIEKKKGKWGIA
jgi:A/G-specific adenine glycosylase